MKVADKQDQILARTKEIERTVLGAILVDNDRYADAREHVSAQDFFSPAHRVIFAAICRRLDAGRPIDLAILGQELTAQQLEDVGGVASVARLIDGVPLAMNVSAYAEEMADKATRRALATAAAQISDLARTGDEPTGTLLEEAERQIFAVRERNLRTEIVPSEARGQAAQRDISEMIDAGGSLRGIPTGLKDLDADMRGLQKGQLIIVAARPSMGKTSLLQHFAMAAGRVDPALIFSLEMSQQELNLREVTTRAQVNSWRLHHGRTTEWEQQRLAYAIEETRQGNVHICDDASITLGKVRALSRRFKAQHGLSMIGLDYIQMMEPEAKGRRSQENRTTELGVLSRGLKGIARALNVPFVVLSQLSRGPEMRPDRRPQLSDLRESGSLEQDADVVLLCFRPNAYKDVRDKQQFKDHYYEINIAKQRSGPTGLVIVAFYRETTRFADWTEDPQWAPARPFDDLPLEDAS